MTELPDKALLPAGMQDGLPPEAANEARAAQTLVSQFDAWGYARVKPPLLEFEENLLFGTGQAMADQAFRVQDPVSQRMMALRPDMTLQVARIAHSRMSHSPRPLRLAYSGQVVRVKGSQLRPERQIGQVGAELIGATNAGADVEVILMAVEALESLGVTGLSVDLGLPTLSPAVIAGLTLDPKIRRNLKTALERKDAAGVSALSDALGDDATKTLLAMLDAVGPAKTAMDKLANLKLAPDADAQRTHLAQVVDGLLAARPDLTLTLDPVERRGFEYHTGVSFALFARAVMGELGRGGRYEAGNNGHREPATGLTLFMDTVMQALPAAVETPSVFLPFGTPPAVAKKLRTEGWRTVQALERTNDAEAEARRLGCVHVLEGGTVRTLKNNAKNNA
jgi:ATP phosphoribosyltransferase regulatory subunit